MWRRLFGVLLCLSVISPTLRAETLHLIGAGSLAGAMSDLIRRFPTGADQVAPAEFGPSGLMRQKIEAGSVADIFASADMAHPRALTAGYAERQVILFTRNQLCALARPTVGLTPGNMLDRLLDPAVRVATSTPGADPGGDYAWAVFARAEALKPGARAALEGKALKLVGGGDRTPLLVPGKGAVEGVFLADKADVMLGYCSGSAGVIREVPGLVSVALPPGLAVGPAYGMALLNAKPVTLRFAAFVMSEAGQAVLRDWGFDPVASAEARPAAPLFVQRHGQAPRAMPAERLAELAQTQGTWGGPLLWDLLVAAGAIDPARPAEQVRLSVRVTGADGYVAVIAAAELSPEFAGRPVLLAIRRDGAPLPGLPRLVVPGEKRGGRAVRDVVRIDVD